MKYLIIVEPLLTHSRWGFLIKYGSVEDDVAELSPVLAMR
jgi:hypothetical protein